MEPLTTIAFFRGDPPTGQVKTPPPPFLSTPETKSALLFVVHPPTHICYNQYIPYFNRAGILLQDGDLVEFETGYLTTDSDQSEQRIYFADILKKL